MKKDGKSSGRRRHRCDRDRGREEEEEEVEGVKACLHFECNNTQPGSTRRIWNDGLE